MVAHSRGVPAGVIHQNIDNSVANEDQQQDAILFPSQSPSPKSCPTFDNRTFAINAYQLYPENMDWDGKLCQVYIGILFNASLGVYNPYKDKLTVINFPGVTLNPDFHVGGVAWDPYTGLASVIVGQGNAFNTDGANITGDNFIEKFDPRTQMFIWRLNITAVSKGIYGGFNDIAHDPDGNTFFCGTYPSSIMKVDPKGQAVIPWYLPATINQTARGYSGIVSHSSTIVVLDSGVGKLFRFDAKSKRGTPTLVPIQPDQIFEGGDSIRLPIKYSGRIMLVALHARGVAVLRSRNADWKTAEYLGLVPNSPTLPAGASVVSTVQIGNSLYIVNEWFGDSMVPGTLAGNRTTFPMVDITEQVDALNLPKGIDAGSDLAR
ncbi:hypothetical protein B0T17DRAFT_618275 [Bombardia bombarda]|uniref:Uncharacterized protein n=1 Tax=Bombardia bombarda TaxID=252184 RepID=A0AA40C1Z7_9PEZI|nr:hypothetical protein B0T17DRAFT_618275 [Bombardia bombarda]